MGVLVRPYPIRQEDAIVPAFAIHLVLTGHVKAVNSRVIRHAVSHVPAQIKEGIVERYTDVPSKLILTVSLLCTVVLTYAEGEELCVDNVKEKGSIGVLIFPKKLYKAQGLLRL